MNLGCLLSDTSSEVNKSSGINEVVPQNEILREEGRKGGHPE